MILLEAFLRGAIVIAIAALLSVVLRNRSAALRHHVWATAIVVQLALLAFIPVLPRINLPVLPSVDAFVTEEPAAATTAQPITNTQLEITTPSSPSPSSSSSPRRSAVAEPTDWAKLALIAWAIGATLILMRYLVGTLIMGRIARRGSRVDDGQWLTLAQRTATELGITRPITLLWGEKLAVPITWGVLYPMILLPENAHEWPAERRRFVLVHEMAHVRRFDALTQLMSQLALALFWFSPMIWIADWRMRVEREHACDDTVLKHGTEPTLYADELLQMVRGLVSRRTARPAFAALAMARRSEFEGRMLAILDPERARSTSGIGSGAAFALLSLLIAAPLAALDPFAMNVTTHVVPAEAPVSSIATPQRNADVCDLTRTATSSNVLVNNEKPPKATIKIKLERPGRCLIGDIEGYIQYTDGDHAIADMKPGSHVHLREIRSGLDYSVRMVAARDGSIDTSYLVDGKATADDGRGHAWIAQVLPEIMRESAEHAERRISWLLAAHNLTGTLETIAKIQSPSARTIHYLTLIEAKTWSDAELIRIRASAARAMQGAATDSFRVMSALPQKRVSTSPDLGSLEKIWSEMGSESDARAAMTALLPSADRSMLFVFMRVAARLDSGFEASSLLMAGAPFYLDTGDEALEDAWFTAATSLGSSFERKNALLTAIKYARGNARIRSAIIKSASSMSSDRDKTAVLTALATAN